MKLATFLVRILHAGDGRLTPMTPTDKELKRAESAMRAIRRRGYAVGAHYDADCQRLVVRLNTGVELSVPISLLQELHAASADDLSEIKVSSSGLGLHWPRLDADVHVPGLLKGIFGTKRWMGQLRQMTDGKRPSFAEVLASMPNVGEDADFERLSPLTRDFRETVRERVLRDPDFADRLAIDMGCARITPAGGNIFLDLGFPPDEAEQLKRDSDQRIAAERALLERDSKRDIGAELLESVRLIKEGNIGDVYGPRGTVVLRCIDLAPLGDLSGDDLEVGRIYVGRADREGWVRIADKSGEVYLYPMGCFEEILPTRLVETNPKGDEDA